MENLGTCLQYDTVGNTISCLTKPSNFDDVDNMFEGDENEFEMNLKIEKPDKFTKQPI